MFTLVRCFRDASKTPACLALRRQHIQRGPTAPPRCRRRDLPPFLEQTCWHVIDCHVESLLPQFAGWETWSGNFYEEALPDWALPEDRVWGGKPADDHLGFTCTRKSRESFGRWHSPTLTLKAPCRDSRGPLRHVVTDVKHCSSLPGLGRQESEVLVVPRRVGDSLDSCLVYFRFRGASRSRRSTSSRCPSYA